MKVIINNQQWDIDKILEKKQTNSVAIDNAHTPTNIRTPNEKMHYGKYAHLQTLICLL